MSQLCAGTSGFAYPSWKPDFYPQKLPAKDFLKHYATKLNAVEINYTAHTVTATIAATTTTTLSSSPTHPLTNQRATLCATSMPRSSCTSASERSMPAVTPALVQYLPSWM